MAIDAAGRRSDIAAVVADGTAAIGYHDIEEYTSKTLDRAPMWLLFKTMEVIRAGSAPKVSLADRIAATRAPHLLVAAGKQEKEWGELYDKAGGYAHRGLVPAQGEPHGRAEAVPGGLRAARQPRSSTATWAGSLSAGSGARPTVTGVDGKYPDGEHRQHGRAPMAPPGARGR